VRPGSAADHSPPSSAEVMEELSYTSTHPLGQTGHVKGYFNFLHGYYHSTDLQTQKILDVSGMIISILYLLSKT
jgi:hypothetical protein